MGITLYNYCTDDWDRAHTSLRDLYSSGKVQNPDGDVYEASMDIAWDSIGMDDFNIALTRLVREFGTTFNGIEDSGSRDDPFYEFAGHDEKQDISGLMTLSKDWLECNQLAPKTANIYNVRLLRFNDKGEEIFRSRITN